MAEFKTKNTQSSKTGHLTDQQQRQSQPGILSGTEKSTESIPRYTGSAVPSNTDDYHQSGTTSKQYTTSRNDEYDTSPTLRPSEEGKFDNEASGDQQGGSSLKGKLMNAIGLGGESSPVKQHRKSSSYDGEYLPSKDASKNTATTSELASHLNKSSQGTTAPGTLPENNNQNIKYSSMVDPVLEEGDVEKSTKNIKQLRRGSGTYNQQNESPLDDSNRHTGSGSHSAEQGTKKHLSSANQQSDQHHSNQHSEYGTGAGTGAGAGVGAGVGAGAGAGTGAGRGYSSSHKEETPLFKSQEGNYTSGIGSERAQPSANYSSGVGEETGNQSGQYSSGVGSQTDRNTGGYTAGVGSGHYSHDHQTSTSSSGAKGAAGGGIVGAIAGMLGGKKNSSTNEDEYYQSGDQASGSAGNDQFGKNQGSYAGTTDLSSQTAPSSSTYNQSGKFNQNQGYQTGQGLEKGASTQHDHHSTSTGAAAGAGTAYLASKNADKNTKQQSTTSQGRSEKYPTSSTHGKSLFYINKNQNSDKRGEFSDETSIYSDQSVAHKNLAYDIPQTETYLDDDIANANFNRTTSDNVDRIAVHDKQPIDTKTHKEYDYEKLVKKDLNEHSGQYSNTEGLKNQSGHSTAAGTGALATGGAGAGYLGSKHDKSTTQSQGDNYTSGIGSERAQPSANYSSGVGEETGHQSGQYTSGVGSQTDRNTGGYTAGVGSGDYSAGHQTSTSSSGAKDAAGGGIIGAVVGAITGKKRTSSAGEAGSPTTSTGAQKSGYETNDPSSGNYTSTSKTTEGSNFDGAYAVPGGMNYPNIDQSNLSTRGDDTTTRTSLDPALRGNTKSSNTGVSGKQGYEKSSDKYQNLAGQSGQSGQSGLHSSTEGHHGHSGAAGTGAPAAGGAGAGYLASKHDKSTSQSQGDNYTSGIGSERAQPSANYSSGVGEETGNQSGQYTSGVGSQTDRNTGGYTAGVGSGDYPAGHQTSTSSSGAKDAAGGGIIGAVVGAITGKKNSSSNDDEYYQSGDQSSGVNKSTSYDQFAQSQGGNFAGTDSSAYNKSGNHGDYNQGYQGLEKDASTQHGKHSTGTGAVGGAALGSGVGYAAGSGSGSSHPSSSTYKDPGNQGYNSGNVGHQQSQQGYYKGQQQGQDFGRGESTQHGKHSTSGAVGGAAIGSGVGYATGSGSNTSGHHSSSTNHQSGKLGDQEQYLGTAIDPSSSSYNQSGNKSGEYEKFGSQGQQQGYSSGQGLGKESSTQHGKHSTTTGAVGGAAVGSGVGYAAGTGSGSGSHPSSSTQNQSGKLGGQDQYLGTAKDPSMLAAPTSAHNQSSQPSGNYNQSQGYQSGQGLDKSSSTQHGKHSTATGAVGGAAVGAGAGYAAGNTSSGKTPKSNDSKNVASTADSKSSPKSSSGKKFGIIPTKKKSNDASEVQRGTVYKDVHNENLYARDNVPHHKVAKDANAEGLTQTDDNSKLFYDPPDQGSNIQGARGTHGQTYSGSGTQRGTADPANYSNIPGTKTLGQKGSTVDPSAQSYGTGSHQQTTNLGQVDDKYANQSQSQYQGADQSTHQGLGKGTGAAIGAGAGLGAGSLAGNRSGTSGQQYDSSTSNQYAGGADQSGFYHGGNEGQTRSSQKPTTSTSQGYTSQKPTTSTSQRYAGDKYSSGSSTQRDANQAYVGKAPGGVTHEQTPASRYANKDSRHDDQVLEGGFSDPEAYHQGKSGNVSGSGVGTATGAGVGAGTGAGVGAGTGAGVGSSTGTGVGADNPYLSKDDNDLAKKAASAAGNPNFNSGTASGTKEARYGETSETRILDNDEFEGAEGKGKESLGHKIKKVFKSGS
ncbi:hypothetical protein CANARDRAFT_16177 [[Candida] arabinofermentans NRRL YB-2248]|uniref:Uncharacterized protein n=1 Tax=[Candida] arabinofermentans NRRL YB-2248 TaxID=983967 RepID=A0A1E4T4L0_9ASCO|nr:hypothetical protein CANARDRAFT_16177 [[Candida] arabinofermentans NRRL YB-2248]